MKNLKAIAAVAAVCVIMGGTMIPVYADQSTVTASQAVETATDNTKILEDAVILVRSRIQFPEEYEEFSDGSVSKRNGVNIASLSWSSKEKTGKTLRVTVTGKLITGYSAENRDYEYKPSFSAFTHEQYTAKALAFAEAANPTMKGQLKLDRCSVQLTDNIVRVRFKRVNDGINVGNNYVNVNLYKDTGVVCSLDADWWRNAEFVAASKAVSQEQIKKIYASEINITPHYRISYSSDGETASAKAVYVPASSIVYDATTGKHTTMDEDRKKYQNTDRYNSYDDDTAGESIEEDACYEAAAAVSTKTFGGYVLSDSEKAGVKKLEHALTAAQFKQILKDDPFIEYDDSFHMDSFNVREDSSYDSGFGITFSAHINNDSVYKSLDVYADAESGRIRGFRLYDSSYSGKKAINVTEANKIAEAAKKYYCGEIDSIYRANADNTAPVVKTKNYTESSRNFRFERYYNNIIVDDQIITIGVNSDNKVTSLNYSYTKDVRFDKGKVLDKSAALNSFLAENDFDLYYDGFTDLESKPHTYLHYALNRWTMNAVTGKKCSYSGEPITQSEEIPEKCPFTDIGGSKYSSEIKTLYDEGITTFHGTKLEPAKEITYREFSELASSIGLWDTYIYKDADIDKTITRLDMAKMFVRSAGCEGAANMKGIYRQIFTDVKSSDKDAGTAAIAYALGAVDAQDGKFNGKSPVTREQAYHALYQYVLNQQKS